MTRFQLFLAFGTFCLQWYSIEVTGKSNFNDKTNEGTDSNVARFIPFRAQLQYASVTIQNNGMVQYVIKVVDANETECYFNFPNLEVETSVNDVVRNGDVVTGILLLERGPSWILFKCFFTRSPILSEFLFTSDVPSNVSTQMELREENGCKISEPVFSSNENSFIIEIQASCSFPLKRDNAFLSLDAAVLNDGNISYYIQEDSFNTTRTYENGVAKARFAVSNHIPTGTIYVPWFTLQLKNKGGEKPLRAYNHMYMSKKALDGTSPVIPRGTVAMAVFPSEVDTIYVKRGSQTRVICEAYGNPKPIIEWKKNGQIIEGEKDFGSLDWDKFLEYQINATLSATQDETSKIFSADCYKGNRATNGAWIKDYDAPVSIIKIETDTIWEQTYSWNIADKEDVPRQMYCEIFSDCVIEPMTFELNV